MSTGPTPTDYLLDPAYAAGVVQEHFRNQLDCARDIASEWSQLLKRCIASTKGQGVPDLIVLAGFFRSGLKAYDASLVCLHEGAVGGAQFAVRSLWEADVFGEWLLSRDRNRWGRQAYVAELRLEREWVRRSVEGTNERKRYLAAWQGAFGARAAGLPRALPNGVQRLQELDEILAAPAYREINEWFDHTRRNRQWEPEWFKPGPDAPTSLYDMATLLDRKVEYQTIYSALSQHTHSSNPRSGFTAYDDGRVAIEPIRAFGSFANVYSLSVSLALQAMIRLLTEYRPDERPIFARRYVELWRARINMPDIVEKPDWVRM